MKWQQQILFVFFLFAFINFSQAQLSFELKISDKKIGKKDVLQIEYAINNANNIGDFPALDFSNWNVVSGPELSQQSISVNGKTTGSTSYIFMISPKKTGVLLVPGANIIADGKKISCSAVSITVDPKDHLISTSTQQTQIPIPQIPQMFDNSQLNSLEQNNVLKPGEDPAQKIRKNIFVKAIVNKKTCFVGEPILVTYQLFSALEASARVNSQPTFSGCSVIEMTNPSVEESIQKIDGKTYRVATIRKVQLIPLQEGEIKLDSATVDNNVQFSSPDNPYQTQDFSATLASNPLTIIVKALPEKGKPDNFSGVVGNFNISANADSISITAGENNILNIKIEGEGNFSGITQPSILWSKNLQHFDGNDSQHIDKTTFPESGDITFQIPFVASKEGSDTIPEISFTFFNNETQQYQTVHSDKIPLHITKAIPRSQKLLQAFSEGNSNTGYLWLVGLIAIIVAVVFLFTGKKKKIIPEKNIVAEEKAPEKNEEVKPVLVFKMKPDFYSQLEVLQNETDNRLFFLKAKEILNTILQEKTNSPSNSTLVLLSELPKFTNEEALIADAENIYKICNYSLYTPEASEDEKVLLQARLELLIKKLEV